MRNFKAIDKDLRNGEFEKGITNECTKIVHKNNWDDDDDDEITSTDVHTQKFCINEIVDINGAVKWGSTYYRTCCKGTISDTLIHLQDNEECILVNCDYIDGDYNVNTFVQLNVIYKNEEE